MTTTLVTLADPTVPVPRETEQTSATGVAGLLAMVTAYIEPPGTGAVNANAPSEVKYWATPLSASWTESPATSPLMVPPTV